MEVVSYKFWLFMQRKWRFLFLALASYAALC